jgi:hypothetical protein
MSLLIDFGATHIKYAVLRNDGSMSAPIEMASPQGERMSIKDIKKIFDTIINLTKPTAVYVSSQMHGFYIDGLDDYISWKCEDGPVSKLAVETGLRPKKGLPIFNITNPGRFMMLPDALLSKSNFCVHDTLFCGTGFYDVINKKTITHPSLEFKRVVSGAPEVAGWYGPGDIPVYTGFGDFQTAVAAVPLGSNDVIINLGTGSQVARLSKVFDPKMENRAYFDGRLLNCVTHIPSGRALEIFLNILGATFEDVQKLCVTDVETSTVVYDLGVFEAAHGFKGSGSIANLFTTTTRTNCIASLIRCYVEQYLKVLELFIPLENIWLTGGIPRKIPLIKMFLEKRLGKVIHTCENDTITGLANVVKGLVV